MHTGDPQITPSSLDFLGWQIETFRFYFKTIPLSPSGNETRRDDSNAKFFNDAAMSLKASLGETAVDFAFAPFAPSSEASVGTSGDETLPEGHLFPIFVLHGNGHVFCLLTG